MIQKTYQRKHLRAPFKQSVLFADGDFVLRAHTLNISEGGLLLDELPRFPEKDEVSLLLALPQLPVLKNFSILKMQTFSKDLFEQKVIRARAQLMRRQKLSQSLDNIFRSRFALKFSKVMPQDQALVDHYVTTYSANLIYLQTLIDSYNTDEETKLRTRSLAQLLGYKSQDPIAQIRAAVTQDYKSLQWS